jgi:hypothetical protein
VSDHRPVYYVTDREAEVVRDLADGGRGDGGLVRIWAPPDGPVEIVDGSGRADCRLCGRRIHRDERAVRFGLLTNPPGDRVVAAYIHADCPEEDA